MEPFHNLNTCFENFVVLSNLHTIFLLTKIYKRYDRFYKYIDILDFIGILIDIHRKINI